MSRYNDIEHIPLNLQGDNDSDGENSAGSPLEGSHRGSFDETRDPNMAVTTTQSKRTDGRNSITVTNYAFAHDEEGDIEARGAGVGPSVFDLADQHSAISSLPFDPVADSKTKTGIIPTAFNFANSIIGAGIIGLPYAFKQAGLWIGLFSVLAIALVIDWSVRKLVMVGRLSGRQSYQAVMRFCFGKAGFYVISVFQFLFAYGAMCAYLVIVGQSLPPVVRNFVSADSPFATRYVWLTIGLFGVMLPLCLPRNVGFLTKSSFISLLSVVYIVIAVTYEGYQTRHNEHIEHVPENYAFWHPNFLQAIGSISFAFVCHHNSFLLYASLKQHSLKRWALVTHLSVFFAMTCCLAVAISAYITFFEETRPNVLASFTCNSVVINIARCCFSLTMFLAFPLELFVAREVLDELFFHNKRMTNLRHVSLTLILVLTVYGIVMATDNLGFVIELTGAIAASTLAFILPGLAYLKLASGKICSIKKCPSLFLVIFGFCVMFVGSILTIVETVTGEDADNSDCMVYATEVIETNHTSNSTVTYIAHSMTSVVEATASTVFASATSAIAAATSSAP